MAWASKLSEKELAKFVKEWNRLRNAVYVTYPYARTAGHLMNDINAHIVKIKEKKEKKKIDYSSAWAEARKIIWNARWRLALGSLLMLISRLAATPPF